MCRLALLNFKDFLGFSTRAEFENKWEGELKTNRLYIIK